MSSGWCSGGVGDLWISQVGCGILRNVGSFNLSVGKDLSLDDLNGISSTSVSTSHFLEHLGNGTAKGGVSELLVHVDDTSSGLVLESDSVVSD